MPHIPSDAVLIVIPCLNEEQHVEQAMQSLLSGADDIALLMVVADGGSTDRTREIVAQIAEQDDRIVLMDNTKKIQSVAVNEAVREFGDHVQFLLRADAHADYPDSYCARLLSVQAATGADSVVVTMQSKGKGCFQRAAAAAQNSILGNGGSSHRNVTRGRWVDHGHHALMRVAAFKAVGGYDEAFSHNEDAELDIRLREAGFRIYLTGETPVLYYPRSTPPALFRQYFRIGRGRARNFLKHRSHAKLRHLVLVAVAPAICLVLLSPTAPVLAFPALAWCLSCLGFGLVLGIRLRDKCVAVAGIAAMLTQAGWSFGFLTEIVVAPVRGVLARLGPPIEPSSTTRGADKVES